MADVFGKDDAKGLLNRKYILFIGDSNVRSLYKDLLWLVSCEGLTTSCYFSRKLGESFLDDRVLDKDGNEYSWHFSEHRSFNKDFRIDLLHMSTVKPNRIIRYIDDMKAGILPEPDVIFFSSFCSKRNLPLLEDVMIKLKTQLPKWTLFMMAKALPMVEDSFGDPLIEEIIYFKAGLLNVPATDYSEIANRIGLMTVDPYFYTQQEVFRGFDSRRDRKGLRFLSNLILTQFAIHMNRKLPGRVDNLVLRQAQLSSLACIKEYRNLERRISNGGGCNSKNDPALINATQFLRMIKTKKHVFTRSETNRKRKATPKQRDVKIRRIDKSPTELMEIGSANVGNMRPQEIDRTNTGKKSKRRKKKSGNQDIKKTLSYRGGVIKSVVFPMDTPQNQGSSNEEHPKTNRNERNTAYVTPTISYNTNGVEEGPSRIAGTSCPQQPLSLECQSEQIKIFDGKKAHDVTINPAIHQTQYRHPNTKELPTSQLKVSENTKPFSTTNESCPQTFSNSPHNHDFMRWLTRNFSHEIKTNNLWGSPHPGNTRGDEKVDLPVINSENDSAKSNSYPMIPSKPQLQIGSTTTNQRLEVYNKEPTNDNWSSQTVKGVNKPELLNMSRFLFDLRKKLNVSSPQSPVMPAIISEQKSNNFKTFSFKAIPPMNKLDQTVSDKCKNPFSIENIALKSLSVQPKPAYKKWRVRKSKSTYSNWQHFPKTQPVRGDGYCMYWPSPLKKRPNGPLLDVLGYP